MDTSRRQFLRTMGAATVVLTAGCASRNVEKRYALLVDTSKCKASEGCRECRTACHQAHNVPDIAEPRHEVKWIWAEPFSATFPGGENEFMDQALRERPVLVLCNHCESPPCVRVCPTQATWKRENGIVTIDMHRCIGCRYCVVGCPYGSRSFNWVDPRPFIKKKNPEVPTRMRGVVEKCNLCEDRLANGQGLACVEACPERALTFGDLDETGSELTERLRGEYTLRRKPGLGTNPKVYYIL
jgi:molybdopterin-containing oxidoreductase family iron-sulfur binding subunit